MTEEEERKAFEASVVANKIVNDIGITSEWDGSRYVSKFSSSKPYTQAMFEVWLAAKAHAIEMHKPKCTIEQVFPMNAKIWNVIDSFGDRVAWSNESKEDAVQWAKDNGYRVIE